MRRKTATNKSPFLDTHPLYLNVNMPPPPWWEDEPFWFWRSEVKGQGHNGNKLMNTIETKPLCISSNNLAAMLTMVNPIDFGGHSPKMKVTMGIIDKCEVCGDATLCVVIFFYLDLEVWPIFEKL